MFAPPRRTDDAIVQARISELVQHGYVGSENGRWFLTEKGWRTLSAAARAKQARPLPQTKHRIEQELEQYHKGIALTAAMPNRGHPST